MSQLRTGARGEGRGTREDAIRLSPALTPTSGLTPAIGRMEAARLRRAPRPSPLAPRPSARGFTLVELLVVIVIISILLGFILNAAMGARRAGEMRQTQALIAKLEGALNDRYDALIQTRPVPNSAHLAMAFVYNSGFYPNQNFPPYMGAMPGYLRAQVIAYYDYIKSEMPDTFFIQNTTGPYPINFAANPYPGSPSDSNGLGNFILPLGNSITPTMIPPQGDGNIYNQAGTGIYGASYAAAAGIYKNLGYVPQGYDGVDNNQNGLIDEYGEGAPNATVQATVTTHLANHTHNTARSEVLYAILVEGRGPLGAVFNADEFTDREVKDTDLDGLPEFVDAWGNPLQFFRWPLLYHSDIQRGQTITPTSENSWVLVPPYLNALQEREQDPLDVNQQLMAPAWWGGYNNSSPVLLARHRPRREPQCASGAQAFEYYFHRLTEPYPSPPPSPYTTSNMWDRGGT